MIVGTAERDIWNIACKDKTDKKMKNAIFTERLDIIPSVETRDLGHYISDLLLTNDFYFQYGEQYSDELLEAIDFHSSGVIYYSIFLKDTPTMVGYVGIFLDTGNPAYGGIEFYIFHNHRRQGFSKEVLPAFINSFFNGSLTGIKGKQVVAETLTENTTVINLLESIGFQKKSTVIRAYFNEDKELDRDKTIGLRRFTLNAET